MKPAPDFVWSAKLAAQIVAIRPSPQELPQRPFSKATALWLCRVCSMWNAPDRTDCRDCQAVRA